MPRWITSAIVILVCLSLIPLTAIYVTRAQRNGDTRLSIIPDMDDQQKFKAQQVNMMFADRRAMRPQVDGTIARGELEADDAFYRGHRDGEWVTGFPEFNPETGEPMVIDADFIMRGQERYNIYCSPCHGYTGDGAGMVSKRVEELMLDTNNGGVNSWTPPLSYHTAQVRNRANGHIFNTITNGIRNMPAYGPQIDPADRWAIVAYVRALENTQAAGMADVPEDVAELLGSDMPVPESEAGTETETDEPTEDAGDSPAAGTEGE